LSLNIFRKSLKNASDEQLMELIAADNSAAFDEIYNRYSKPILFFFNKMLGGDEELAQDFLHDLFLKIIEKPYLFDQSKKFKPWIYQIAHNKCKNEFRDRNVRQRLEKNIVVEHNLIFDSTSKNTPEELVNNKMLVEEILSQVEQLSLEHKTTFTLRYQNGLSIKEIANVLDCPDGTIKSRLYNATQKIMEYIKKNDPELVGEY